MSLQTWKDEFYPKEPTKHMTAIEATKHSLHKWEGALKKNLKKHGVTYVGYDISDENSPDEPGFAFMADTCALCVRFYDDEGGPSDPCSRCPLFTCLGESCAPSLGRTGAFDQSADDPKPMIRALRKTLRMLQRKSKKGSK